jgi:hypothetical protein
MLRGRPAERLIALVERPWLVAAAPEADGEGDTCGNAEPRSPVGWIPTPGTTVPLGRDAGESGENGSVVPSPAFWVCDEDEESPPADFLLISTVTDADADFDACAEVAVAVSVT